MSRNLPVENSEKILTLSRVLSGVAGDLSVLFRFVFPHSAGSARPLSTETAREEATLLPVLDLAMRLLALLLLVTTHSGTFKFIEDPKCPAARPRTPAQCRGQRSKCWSPGVRDTDCPGHGLCCYDGCANTCIASRSPPPPAPPVIPPPSSYIPQPPPPPPPTTTRKPAVIAPPSSYIPEHVEPPASLYQPPPQTTPPPPPPPPILPLPSNQIQIRDCHCGLSLTSRLSPPQTGLEFYNEGRN